MVDSTKHVSRAYRVMVLLTTNLVWATRQCGACSGSPRLAFVAGLWSSVHVCIGASWAAVWQKVPFGLKQH